MPHGRVSKTGKLQSTRILVVVACPATRALIADSLTLHGYRVDTASDCAEGLAKFCCGGCDLVMTDHDMPQLDGHQLAATIKATAPGMPVLVASAAPCGTLEFFVRKPFTLVRLRAAISSIVCLHRSPISPVFPPTPDQ